MRTIKDIKTADGKCVSLSIGDTIIIVNKGKTYSAYDDMASMLKLNNFACNYSPQNRIKGKIIGMKMHEFMNNEVCVGVRLYNGREIIIGPKGIKKISECSVVKLDDKLFEL